MLSESEIVTYDGIAVLDGPDKMLKNFVNRHLKTRIKKGLDVVIKVYDTYIIGEAKFLTAFGGHQTAQFNDPYSLLRSHQSNVIRIAILDGVILLPTNNAMNLSVKKQDSVAISALLLKDFIKEVSAAAKPSRTPKKKSGS